MKLKFGVLGAAGYWGKHFLRLLSECDEAELVCVCDKNIELANEIAHKYKVEATDDYNLLLSKCEAIVIVTPAKTHYALAKKALMQGKHVLVEKPMTTSFTECRELIEIAEKNGAKLMCGHTYLYNENINYLKEYIKENRSDILYINMVRIGKSPIRADVGSIFDLSSHDISILIHWLGMPKSVSSFGKSYLQDGLEDVAWISMTFDNNIVAHIHVSWYSPVKERKITIVGRERMLEFDDLAIGSKITTFNGENKIHNAPNGNLEPLKVEVTDFIYSILTDKQPLSDGAFSLKVVRVLEAAMDSLNHKNITVYL